MQAWPGVTRTALPTTTANAAIVGDDDNSTSSLNAAQY